MTKENSWAVIFHSGAFLLITPALFSNKSAGPHAASNWAAHAFTSSSKEISTASRSWAPSNSLRSDLISFSVRPHPATVYPNRANSMAIARPKPRVTPVITTNFEAMVFPSNGPRFWCRRQAGTGIPPHPSLLLLWFFCLRHQPVAGGFLLPLYLHDLA